jgi:hypothetical protein
LQAAEALHNQQEVTDQDFLAVGGTLIATQQQSGWITQPSVAPAIWQQLPDMQPGQVKLFQIETGSFLIRRGQHEPPSQMTYDQAAPLIRQQLQQRNQEQHWQEFLEKYRTK